VADWDPVNPDSEWATAEDPAASVADGSITNAKLAGDIDPRKITGFGMKIALSASQNVAVATEEPVEYDTEVFRSGFEPIDTFQIPVPYDGVYLITVGVSWYQGGGADVDEERAWITINGDQVQGNASPNLSSPRQRYTMSASAVLTAGDLVGLTVKHASAGARNLGVDEPTANNLTVIYLFTI
jgi:hypothetical protein